MRNTVCRLYTYVKKQKNIVKCLFFTTAVIVVLLSPKARFVLVYFLRLTSLTRR